MATTYTNETKVRELALSASLSSYFKTIDGECIVGSGNLQRSGIFDNVQILRPAFQQHTHVKLVISREIDFTEHVETSSEDYPECFFGLSHHSSDSIEWTQCTSDGFSAQYSNKPILIKLQQILDKLQFSSGKELYIKYAHYWKDSGGTVHQSDMNALIVPASTEVGANAQEHATNSAVKKKCVVNPDANDQGMYAVSYDCMSVIDIDSSGIVDNKIMCLLAGYNPSEAQAEKYEVMITTGKDDIDVSFSYDNGNGPQAFDPEKTVTVIKNSTCTLTFRHEHVFAEYSLL